MADFPAILCVGDLCAGDRAGGFRLGLHKLWSICVCADHLLLLCAENDPYCAQQIQRSSVRAKDGGLPAGPALYERLDVPGGDRPVCGAGDQSCVYRLEDGFGHTVPLALVRVAGGLLCEQPAGVYLRRADDSAADEYQPVCDESLGLYPGQRLDRAAAGMWD